MNKIITLIYLTLLLIFFSCKSSGDPLFTSTSKKGPNVEVDGGISSKSKSKNYIHATSRKKIKGKRGSPFSSSKSRYGKIVNVKSNNKESKKGEASGGRKSGKGRKKQ